MKSTLSWLKTYLDTTASVEDITDALTDLGLEVERGSKPRREIGGVSSGP